MANQARFFYQDENAPKPNRPNSVGTVVLIECDGKLLFEHRTDSEVWAIIGGGLGTQEALAEGAAREVWEETGIQVDPKDLTFFGIYDDPSRIASYPDGNIFRILTIAYRLRLSEIPVLRCSNESRELRFFSGKALADIAIARTHVPILKDYLASIIKVSEKSHGEENDIGRDGQQGRDFPEGTAVV